MHLNRKPRRSIVGLVGESAWRQRMQIVFQDPYASLNARMAVAEIIGEALDTHKLAQDRRDARIRELLERVGLNADHRKRYPHDFSGGQRIGIGIGIGRGLAVEPDFIVADEPVSAPDVSVHTQVLNLLQDLHRPPNPPCPRRATSSTRSAAGATRSAPPNARWPTLSWTTSPAPPAPRSTS